MNLRYLCSLFKPTNTRRNRVNGVEYDDCNDDAIVKDMTLWFMESTTLPAVHGLWPQHSKMCCLVKSQRSKLAFITRPKQNRYTPSLVITVDELKDVFSNAIPLFHIHSWLSVINQVQMK